jgi:hypothetical protein
MTTRGETALNQQQRGARVSQVVESDVRQTYLFSGWAACMRLTPCKGRNCLGRKRQGLMRMFRQDSMVMEMAARWRPTTHAGLPTAPNGGQERAEEVRRGAVDTLDRPLQGKVGNVPSLPGRLHRVAVVVPPHECHRLTRRHAVQHGDAGEGGAGPAAAAPAGNLYTLCLGATPGFEQRVPCIARVSREPEVRPPDPACIPIDIDRSFIQQVDGEVREGACRQPSAERTATY